MVCDIGYVGMVKIVLQLFRIMLINKLERRGLSNQSWGRYFIIVTSYILLVTYEQCNIL